MVSHRARSELNKLRDNLTPGALDTPSPLGQVGQVGPNGVVIGDTGRPKRPRRANPRTPVEVARQPPPVPRDTTPQVNPNSFFQDVLGHDPRGTRMPAKEVGELLGLPVPNNCTEVEFRDVNGAIVPLFLCGNNSKSGYCSVKKDGDDNHTKWVVNHKSVPPATFPQLLDAAIHFSESWTRMNFCWSNKVPQLDTAPRHGSNGAETAAVAEPATKRQRVCAPVATSSKEKEKENVNNTARHDEDWEAHLYDNSPSNASQQDGLGRRDKAVGCSEDTHSREGSASRSHIYSAVAGLRTNDFIELWQTGSEDGAWFEGWYRGQIVGYDCTTEEHSVRLDSGTQVEADLTQLTWAPSKYEGLRKERLSAEEALRQFGLRQDGSFEDVIEQENLSESSSQVQDPHATPAKGTVVEVYWGGGYKGWYRGTVVEVNESNKPHKIRFDDGNEKSYDLKYENWAVSKCKEKRRDMLSVEEAKKKGIERRALPQKPTKAPVSLEELCEAAANDVPAQLHSELQPGLNSAQRLLGLSGGAVRMVGRAREMSKIIEFAERVVCKDDKGGELGEHKAGGSNALFVSGMPGSGKSAVVSLVAKQVVNWGKAKGNVRLLELNAMHILEAKTIYSKILSGLHDTSISTGNSNPNDDRQRLLRDIDARGRKLLLVVDEVDQLHTRDEEVLYDLFELSARPKSRLALLSIANSLNMTERFLPRLKEMNALPEEVNFEPYKSSDIMNIIKSRLPEPHINAFDEHAITMCAAKVASSGSGDIRKALDICRAAVGHAMEHGSNVVAVKHMAATIGKLMGSKQVATCMALPQSQQVMVCALMHVFGGRVQSPLLLTKVHEGYRSFCKLHTNTMTSLSKGELVDVLHVLESQGLLELSGSVKKQVKMNISEAEVRRALEKIGDGSFFRNLLDTKLP